MLIMRIKMFVGVFLQENCLSRSYCACLQTDNQLFCCYACPHVAELSVSLYCVCPFTDTDAFVSPVSFVFYNTFIYLIAVLHWSFHEGRA